MDKKKKFEYFRVPKKAHYIYAFSISIIIQTYKELTIADDYDEEARRHYHEA